MSPVMLLDATLALTLVFVAVRVLASAEPFQAVSLFIAFGLLMTLAWVRLDAIDIALAEAGIGAGFTGALLLVGVARLRQQTREQERGGEGGEAEQTSGTAGTTPEEA